MRKTLESVGHALRGLKTVWREERNFRLEILAGIIALLLACYFKLNFAETTLVIISIFAVLCAEIANTALEDLTDEISPAQNERIGKVKDTMASFVLIASIGALMLGVSAFTHHFGLLNF